MKCVLKKLSLQILTLVIKITLVISIRKYMFILNIALSQFIVFPARMKDVVTIFIPTEGNIPVSPETGDA